MWTIIEHAQPVRADDADVQIDVVNPEFPDVLERLVVRRVSEDRFQVCCIPFVLYDVCLGDTVRVTGLTKDTPGRIAERVSDAGRSVYRASFTPGNVAEIPSLASTAASSGLDYEIYHDRLVAIDVDGSQEPHVIRELLIEGAVAGRWEWETGRQQGATTDAGRRP